VSSAKTDVELVNDFIKSNWSEFQSLIFYLRLGKIKLSKKEVEDLSFENIKTGKIVEYDSNILSKITYSLINEFHWSRYRTLQALYGFFWQKNREIQGKEPFFVFPEVKA